MIGNAIIGSCENTYAPANINVASIVLMCAIMFVRFIVRFQWMRLAWVGDSVGREQHDGNPDTLTLVETVKSFLPGFIGNLDRLANGIHHANHQTTECPRDPGQPWPTYSAGPL